MIKLKGLFEPASQNDCFRIFIGRLWPEGLKKNNAAIDLWIKEIAPSVLLREWFDHDPDKRELFERRYTEELGYNKSVMEIIKEYQKHQIITLLYSSEGQEHNYAVILQKFLTGELEE